MAAAVTSISPHPTSSSSLYHHHNNRFHHAISSTAAAAGSLTESICCFTIKLSSTRKISYGNYRPFRILNTATKPTKSPAEEEWKIKRQVLLEKKVRSVDAKEAFRLEKENKFVILDVRPEAEYKEPIFHAPPSQPPHPSLTGQSRMETKTLRSSLVKENKCVSQSHTVLPLLNGNVNSTAYASVLDSCSCPIFGKQVHSHLLKNGFHKREYIGAQLLKMYAKFGCFHDVALVFDKMPEKNLYTYAALLNVFLDSGLFEEALVYFKRLLLEGIELEFFIFPVVLKICGGHGGIVLGKQLHGLSTKSGVSSHVYVGNALIDMYGKCGSLSNAERILDNMLGRDCISWNSMITACSNNGMVFEAMKFLEEMLKEFNSTPDFVSWSSLISGFAHNGYDHEAVEILYKMRTVGCEPSARALVNVLPACGRLGKLQLGKEIYGYITRHGFMSTPYIVNGLIELYRRCDEMASAVKVFSRFSDRDEVSFNTMIAGYCDCGNIVKANEVFDQMEHEGKQKGLISWNSMISGYANNFMFEESLGIFIDLLYNGGIEPNSFTLGSVLRTCCSMGSLRLGKGIHSYCIVKGLESDLYVGGALVEMYCRCSDLEAAEKAFHKVPKRDIVIWNSLISGYARLNQSEKIQCILQRMKNDGVEPNVHTWNGIIAGVAEIGHHELALVLFLEMQASKLRPDIYTVGIVLLICSTLATLVRGKQVHAYAIRCGFESDAYITSALIDMYSKSGNMIYAKLVLKCSRNQSLVTQNAMLNAYAMHGRGEEGIAFFHQMLMDGFKPDGVTFLAVLSTCVHAGSVNTGEKLFDLMKTYGVIPTLKHYTCMVDLLSRTGRLRQAFEIVKSMTVEPDSVIWGALLGGCISHGDVSLGEIAAHKLIGLQPDNTGNYVMLANLYASGGKWHEFKEIRQQMKVGELHKDPGCSWIEYKDEIHAFMAHDKSHRRAKDIYDILDHVTTQIRLKHVLA